VLVVALAFYAFSPGPTPTVDPANRNSGNRNSSENPKPPPGSKTLEVALTEGSAQVYRGGTLLGMTSATKPLRIPAQVGEKVGLLLKQEGFEDKTVPQFTVESYWPDVKMLGPFNMAKVRKKDPGER
jgi:hypothetical protein